MKLSRESVSVNCAAQEQYSTIFWFFHLQQRGSQFKPHPSPQATPLLAPLHLEQIRSCRIQAIEHLLIESTKRPIGNGSFPYVAIYDGGFSWSRIGTVNTLLSFHFQYKQWQCLNHLHAVVYICTLTALNSN